MFSKVLVANRGEIAVRIIRACREMGIPTVAVYSEADRKALHTRLADEAYCIGKAPSVQSYLNYPEIIHVAKMAKADAVHPGYGFLSENRVFSEVCEICKIKVIGPPPSAVARMGEKAMARSIAEKAGVPIPMGSTDAVKDDLQASRIGEQIGFPLLIKATAGGGGKGMRIVREPKELIPQLHAAQEEAKAAFGNKDVYMERFVEGGRHVEIQILADTHGNVVHLGERECSVQRRHQKLIEEAPSPAVNRTLREKMGRTAIRLAKAVDYVSAGTVEFLVDNKKNIFFIEMNTRIQVEHPITELVTGIDIVKEQIRIAAGHPISFRQKDLTISGHAIECRINAEDPDRDFMPSPGKIRDLCLPGGPGVRMDTHIFGGYHVPPYYDSMLGKLIVHAEDRPSAILRMRRALDELHIGGVSTTKPFHEKVLVHDAFVKGNYTTKFVDEFLLK